MDPTAKITYFFSTAETSACKLLTLEFISFAEQDSDTGPAQMLMNKDDNLEYLFYLWEA